MSSAAATQRRISQELKVLHKKPIREFCLVPLEENNLQLHFTYLGPEDSPYEGGLYHGVIMIPEKYPFAPPDVMLLTPNGRFQLKVKVCLSVSSYHPECWKPTWGIATVLHALRDFMTTPGNNGIGAINYPEKLRKELAANSHSFVCPECGAKVEEQWENIMKNAPPATEADKGEMPPKNPPTPKSTPAGGSETSPAPPSPLATAAVASAASTPVASVERESSSASIIIQPPLDVETAPVTVSSSPPRATASVTPTTQVTPVAEEPTTKAEIVEDNDVEKNVGEVEKGQQDQEQEEVAAAAQQQPPAPAPAPLPPAVPPVPPVRRHENGVELNISISTVDRLLVYVGSLLWLLILRKVVMWYVIPTVALWMA